MRTKKLLVVDTLNSFFTLFHNKSADKAWTFIRDMRTLIEQFKFDRVIFCAEGGQSRYRLALHPGYKEARRKKRAESTEAEKRELEQFLKTDLNDMLEIAKLLGIPHITVPGVEADDLIAWFSKHMPEHWLICNLSTDKDLYQLLDHRTAQAGYGKAMTLPMSAGHKIPPKVWLKRSTFIEETGITPLLHAQAKALSGDAGDSVYSPKGLGEIGARALILKYGDLAGVEAAAKLPGFHVPRLTDSVKAELRDNFARIWNNLLLVDLNYGPEVEQELIGKEGLAMLAKVALELEENAEVDVEGLVEEMLRCGKTQMAKSARIWSAPFTGPAPF
jgi:5'-3' exonuclease